MTTKISSKASEAHTLFQNLDKPSLHALSYILRHPDTWPKNFVWNFNRCTQCAMGLAHQLWKIGPYGQDNGPSHIARAFAMPYGAAADIFMADGDWVPTKEKTKTIRTGFLGLWREQETYDVIDVEAITPEMVADQIDAYLATRE